MAKHDPQWTHEAAAYVLGALSLAARRRYERHLSSCPACRAEVADLAGVRALLARLYIDEPGANWYQINL